MAIDNNSNDKNGSDIIKSQLASAYEDGIVSVGGLPEKTEPIDNLYGLKVADATKELYTTPGPKSGLINPRRFQTIASMQILTTEVDNIIQVLRARTFEDIIDTMIVNKTMEGFELEQLESFDMTINLKLQNSMHDAELFFNDLAYLLKTIYNPEFLSVKGQLFKRANLNFTGADIGGDLSYGGSGGFYGGRNLPRAMSSGRTIDTQMLRRYLSYEPLLIPPQPHITPAVDILNNVLELINEPISDVAKMTTTALLLQCFHEAEAMMRYGVSPKFMTRLGLATRTNYGTDAAIGDSTGAAIFKLEPDIPRLIDLFDPFYQPEYTNPDEGYYCRASSRPDLIGWGGTSSYSSDPTDHSLNPVYRINKRFPSLDEIGPLDRLLYFSSVLSKENILSDGIWKLGYDSTDEKLLNMGLDSALINAIRGSSGNANSVLGRPHWGPAGTDLWSHIIGHTHFHTNANFPVSFPLSLGQTSGLASLLQNDSIENPRPGLSPTCLNFETGDPDMDEELGVIRLGNKDTIIGNTQWNVKNRPGDIHETLIKSSQSFADIDSKYRDIDRGLSWLIDTVSTNSQSHQSTCYLPRKIVGTIFTKVGKIINRAAAYDMSESIAENDASSPESGSAVLDLSFITHYLNPNKRSTSSYKKLKRLFVRRVCESWWLKHNKHRPEEVDDYTKPLRILPSNPSTQTPARGQRGLSKEFQLGWAQRLIPQAFYTNPYIHSEGNMLLRNTLDLKNLMNVDAEADATISVVSGITSSDGSGPYTADIKISRSTMTNTIWELTDSPTNYRATLKNRLNEILAIDTIHQSGIAKTAKRLRVESPPEYPGVCGEMIGAGLRTSSFRTSGVDNDFNEMYEDDSWVSSTAFSRTLIDEIIEAAQELDILLKDAEYAGASRAHMMDKGDQIALITEMFIDVINMFISGKVVAGRILSYAHRSAPTKELFYTTETSIDAELGTSGVLGISFTPADIWEGKWSIFHYVSYLKNAAAASGTGGSYAGAILNNDSYNIFADIEEVWSDSQEHTYGENQELEMKVGERVLKENFHTIYPSVEPDIDEIYGPASKKFLDLKQLGSILSTYGGILNSDQIDLATYDKFINAFTSNIIDFPLIEGASGAESFAATMLFANGVVGFTSNGDPISLPKLYEMTKDLTYEGGSIGLALSPASAIICQFLDQNINNSESASIQGVGDIISKTYLESPEYTQKILESMSIKDMQNKKEQLFDIVSAHADLTGMPDAKKGLQVHNTNRFLDKAAILYLNYVKSLDTDQHIIYFGMPKGLIEKRWLGLASQDARVYFGDTTMQQSFDFERSSELCSFIEFKSKRDPIIFDHSLQSSRWYITSFMAGLDTEGLDADAPIIPELVEFDELVLGLTYYKFSLGQALADSNSAGGFIDDADFQDNNKLITGYELVAEAESEDQIKTILENLRRVVESELLKYIFERTTKLTVDEGSLSEDTCTGIEEPMLKHLLQLVSSSSSFKDAHGANWADKIPAIIENLFEEDTSHSGQAMSAATGSKIITVTLDEEKLKKVFEPQLVRVNALQTKWSEPLLNMRSYSLIQALCSTVWVRPSYVFAAIGPTIFDEVIGLRVGDLGKMSDYDINVVGTDSLITLNVGNIDELKKFLEGEAGSSENKTMVAEALSGNIKIDNYRPVITTSLLNTNSEG